MAGALCVLHHAAPQVDDWLQAGMLLRRGNQCDYEFAVGHVFQTVRPWNDYVSEPSRQLSASR